MEKINKINLPETRGEAYKFLLIEYCQEHYIRCNPLEIDGRYTQHHEIKDSFIEELVKANLPAGLGKIRGGTFHLSEAEENKLIIPTFFGSSFGIIPDFNLVKELIEKEHPDYEVVLE